MMGPSDSASSDPEVRFAMDAELEHWRSQGQWFDQLGYEVFYRREGAGPVLLLMHGYPFNSFDWQAVWPSLRERFSLIAPDMLGMGFSAKPVTYHYSVHDHADMHEALLDHLGVSECHILAHDLGDSVAQELLSRYEERPPERRPYDIRSITWLNGGLFVETYRPRLIQTLTVKTPLGGLFAKYPRVFLGDAVLRPAINEVFGPHTKPSDEQWRRFSEILDYNDGRRVAHKVGRFNIDRFHHRNRWVRAMRRTGLPMRFIDGPADPNSGRHMAARYTELIPEPDVVLLGDAIGHWPQIEDPDGVLSHFLGFIEPLVDDRSRASGQP
jgi:pimeloyl-ACP methyl ester carboxylesterase